MTSYDVTIQVKALCLYLHMVLLVCRNFRNEIWKFARNLALATFGSERVKNENGDGNDDKEFSFIIDAPYDFKFPHAKFYIID